MMPRARRLVASPRTEGGERSAVPPSSPEGLGIHVFPRSSFAALSAIAMQRAHLRELQDEGASYYPGDFGAN